MCIGLTSVCGYGVQISHVRHFIDPEKILAYLQSVPYEEQAVTFGPDWLYRFNSAYRDKKLQMLEDESAQGKAVFAAAIAAMSATAGVVALGDFDEGGAIIHLPKYPWSRSMIDLSESESAICDAVAPFLLPGVERDAIRELIDYFDDAEEYDEVLM